MLVLRPERVQSKKQCSSNAPSVETLELAAEPEWEMEEEVEMSDCAIEGEGQGLTPDLAVAAP
jgi:hypothetical protein